MKKRSATRVVRGPGYRKAVKLGGFGPSPTQQQFMKDCDINNLMKRYRATGLLPQYPGTAQYLDCTKMPEDYQAALNKVVAANQAFESLSSDIRAQFLNDPARFVEFASDPKNLDQMREWKLAPPAPMKVATLDDVVDAVKASKEPVAKGDIKGDVSRSA